MSDLMWLHPKFFVITSCTGIPGKDRFKMNLLKVSVLHIVLIMCISCSSVDRMESLLLYISILMVTPCPINRYLPKTQRAERDTSVHPVGNPMIAKCVNTNHYN